MPAKEQTVHASVHLPVDLHRRVRMFLAPSGATFSEFVRELLVEAVTPKAKSK